MKKCVKIILDCQENDEVDIKCGGPDCLGYDFFVPVELAESMSIYIMKICKELQVPMIGVYYDADDIYEKKIKDVWTKERIYNCIKNNEAGLDFNDNFNV